MPKPAKTKRRLRWLIILSIIVIALVLGGDYAYGRIYEKQVFAGVKLAGINIGGLSYTDLRQIVQEKINSFTQKGITFRSSSKEVALKGSDPGYTANYNPDNEWLKINTDQIASSAINYGRGSSWLANLGNRLVALVGIANVKAQTLVDEPLLKQSLKNNFDPEVTFAKPVTISLNNGNLLLTDSHPGQRWDYDQAISQTKQLVTRLESGVVELALISDVPQIKRTDINTQTLSRVNDIINLAPINLVYQDQKWTIDKNTLTGWLRFTNINGDIKITLDQSMLEKYLLTEVATNINLPAREAKFSIENGKVTVFEPPHDGQRLDVTATLTAIETGLIIDSTSTLALVVTAEPAPDGVVNEMFNSVKELVGFGTSSFAGSPPNRRHNIAVGAAAVNGTIIQPGEEFSLLKTLGDINAATGYLPELVIKENKTIPEYGGGLCQIGTTAFRAALGVGVPITERRNHSYRVQYYEPAGTDATIYDPAPDFKFKNDYSAPLLFQTHINGDVLTFELWGTKDSRVISRSYPTIYNIKKPAPAKIIETLNLKPGEKKCTEKAHNGADAKFTYSVTYPDGQKVDKEFFSHYVPWQEVCLLGVKTLSASSTSSTAPVLSSPDLPPVTTH